MQLGEPTAGTPDSFGYSFPVQLAERGQGYHIDIP